MSILHLINYHGINVGFADIALTLPQNNFYLSKRITNVYQNIYNRLMKGKAPRKHSLHQKTAASVLLKPFISSNE